MIYTILGSDKSLVTWTDTKTGLSGNYPRLNDLTEKQRKQLFKLLDAKKTRHQDVVDYLLKLGGGKSEKILKIRKKLGIKIEKDHLVIDGVVFPKRIVKLIESVDTEKEALAILKFAKRVKANPYLHCQESLIEWVLQNPSITFTPDGHLIGYRAVLEDYTSQHSGYGIVNGVETNGRLSNKPGNVLEFPRVMIDHNPSNHCSIGLHVGTWDYAIHFLHYKENTHRVAVVFDPADVVSPPNDARQEKIRVCKFTVLEEVHAPYTEIIHKAKA